MIIKKQIYYITLLLLLMSGSIYGLNNQKMLPIESPVYKWCKALFLEQGMAVPFPSYPWSVDELKLYLSRIDEGNLSPAGKKTFRKILDSIAEKPDYTEGELFAYKGAVEVNLESFLHVPILTPEGENPEDYVWIHGYEERLPILNMPQELWILNWLYLTTEIEIKEEYMTVNSPKTPEITDNHWNIPLPENPQIDIYFPFRAYASTGQEHWTARIGRDQLSWGNGNNENLILSDNVDYFDFLSFTTYWDRFKFSSFNMSLEPRTPREPVSTLSFLGHRFEVNLFDRFNISFFETIISTLTAGQFFKELNHLNIYHNWLAGHACYSIAALELNVNPWKYINIYAQGALDEFMTEYEANRTGGGGEAKMGWLLGIEGMIPLGDSYLDIFFEWTNTNPFLYHRRAAPYHYAIREIWSLVTDTFEYITKPIGYEHGPDAIDWYLEASYTLFSRIDLQVDIEYLIQGETTIASDWDPTFHTAPTGIPEKKLFLHLNGEYHIFDFLSTGTDLYYIHIEDKGHVVGETAKDFEWAWYIKYVY